MLAILLLFIFAFANKGKEKTQERKTKASVILTYVAPSVSHFFLKKTPLNEKKMMCLYACGSRGLQRDLVHSVSFCDLWMSRALHMNMYQPGRCYTYWPSLTETDNQFGCHSLSFWGFLAANECQGDIFDPVGPARN